MSELLSAILLGVVEGLTEFIPVSSTGHLILVGHFIRFTGSKVDTFEIFIQLGAILAVVVLYLPRFLALADLHSSSPFAGLQGLLRLFIVSLPALILGAMLHGTIKEQLFSPWPVSLALIAGGIVMIAIERRKHEPTVQRLEEISLARCLGIGVFQCFSLWPGISRSASTIIGGVLLGLDRRTAAEFSFIAAVPVMCAAVGYDMLKNLSRLSTGDVPWFAAGFVVSFLTAIFAIRFFLSLLQRITLAPFGVYRILLGIVTLVVLLD